MIIVSAIILRQLYIIEIAVIASAVQDDGVLPGGASEGDGVGTGEG